MPCCNAAFLRVRSPIRSDEVICIFDDTSNTLRHGGVSALYSTQDHPIQQTKYPKVHPLFGTQPITRRSFAILTTAWVQAGLAAPVFSSEVAQGIPPTTLKILDGVRKPTFSLDDLHGDRRDLHALAGKVILVHFFATWCEPCVREISSLQRLASATRDKPLAIFAIDVAEVDLRVRAFFEKLPVHFTVLLDRDRAVSKAWDITALPTSFVLDATLTPRFFIEGDLDWSSPSVLAAIEPLYLTADRRSQPLPKQADNRPDHS